MHAYQEAILLKQVTSKTAEYETLKYCKEILYNEPALYDKIYKIFINEYNARMNERAYITSYLENKKEIKENDSALEYMYKKAYRFQPLIEKFQNKIQNLNLDYSQMSDQEKNMYGFPLQEKKTKIITKLK